MLNIVINTQNLAFFKLVYYNSLNMEYYI